jgi:hypothetical protein
VSFKVADRVHETTTVAGTGDAALLGALIGYQAFSTVLSDGDACYYCIEHSNQWEVGRGTFNAANTLTRTDVLDSSNGGNAVDFTVGTKQIYITLPAAAVDPPSPTVLTAGETIAAGDLLTVNSSGQAIKAVNTYPASPEKYNVIGVSRYACVTNASCFVDAIPGRLYPVNCNFTPDVADIGKQTYLHSSGGTCTLTPPATSAAVIRVGTIIATLGGSQASILFKPSELVLLP